VDPYLFENFNTVDGDFLTAKFRAFKFPESTYVQFRGTVNVCLDKCRGVSTAPIRDFGSVGDRSRVYRLRNFVNFQSFEIDRTADRFRAIRRPIRFETP